MTIGSLVGRDGAERTLETALESACAGSGGLVLVTGEAGIGKSALVNWLLGRARGAGALVGTGTCWEGQGAPGYWPWAQVTRALRLSCPAEIWASAASEAGAGLDRLLGGTGRVSAEASAFDVTDATNTVLQVLAADRPVVITIDDLQWADEASVALLGHLTGPAALSPVLLVGTYRDDEVSTPGAQRGRLAELSVRATTVHLSGLDEEGCAALLAQHLDADVARDLPMGELHRKTGGNPFFLHQLAQLWASNRSVRTTPSGVEAAVERRVARLPAVVADALARASILGQRFTSTLAAAAAGQSLDSTDALLRQAEGAGLVLREDASDPTIWRFVHDLVREVLQNSVPLDDRRRMHAAATRALQVTPDASATVAAAECARHAVLSEPELPRGEVAEILLAAAADASGRLAAVEAVGHLQGALARIDATGAERLVVVEQLATEQRRAGLLEDSRATLDQLLQQASLADDAGAYARAALGLHELGAPIDPVGHPEHLVSARRRLERDERLSNRDRDALTARVVGAAVRHRVHRTESDRSGLDEESATAVALAQRSGDPAALAFVMLARHDAIWEPTSAEERLALTVDMGSAARAAGDPEMELQGLLLEFVARLELGQDAAFRTIERYWALAEQLSLPRCRYVALTRRATVATLQGRFEEAKDLLERAYALGVRLGEVDREGVYCDQSWELARHRGGPGAIDELVLRFRGDPHVVVLEVTAALERGDRAECERLYESFHELGVVWPRWAQLLWWSLEAEVVASLGSDARARQLRDLLAPFADRWVVLGGGVVARGPVAYFEALLDAALGDLDKAVSGFERAGAAAERLGARPWVVHARAELGRALLARGGPGDRVAAEAVVEAASDEATSLGMTSLGLTRLVAARPPVIRSRFARDGEVWTLAFAGTTVQLADVKGLGDIQTLIRNAGRDVSALDLLAPAAGDLAGAARRLGADAVLDESALRAYRERLVDLDERIDVALGRGDDDKAQRLDGEREALLVELRSATGLGGRPRRLGDEAERARKAVSARVRDALRRIGDRHPTLGAHLTASISTGSSCRYATDEPIAWET